MIAAPNEAGGPIRTLHRLGVAYGGSGSNHVSRLLALRPGQTAYRELSHPVLGRRIGKARGPGVDGPVVDDPAILRRLRAIEAADLQPDLFVFDCAGNDFGGDVRGILQVVP